MILANNFPAAFKPIFNSVYGEYKDVPLVHQKIFEMLKSKDRYEIDILFPGFGLASEINEQQGMRYENVSQGDEVRYDHAQYQNGYSVSEIAMKDLKTPANMERWTRQLLKGMRVSKEVITHGLLNAAFTTTLDDGVALCSASHPTSVGVYSNTPSVQSALSEAALEQAVLDIRAMVDDKGLLANLKPIQLIIHPDNEFEARRILHSEARVNTANNDLNALKAMGILQGEPVITDYLTTHTNWFVQTDAMDGLKLFQNMELEVRSDNDFDHRAIKIAALERYAFGCTDKRGIYGSQGTV